MKQVIRKNIKEKYNIDDTPPIYTLIIDGNSLLKMSLVNKKLNKKNEEIGGAFTFLLLLRNIINKYDFNFCYCFWDGLNSGQLRANFYPLYKSNRDKHYDINLSEYDQKINEYVKKVLAYSKNKKQEVKRGETDDESFQRQREIIFKCLEELFVRQGIYDQVEGDDLIAYYVKNKKPNEKIIIVSGDRDLTQLISDDISVYVTQLKKFISPKNHLQELGYTHENVVLKKILCGDASDNIKGVKGLGETTLFKYFPNIRTEKATLEAIVERSKELLEERKAEKKKPLKCLENIVNGVSDIGIDNLYEVNKKLIDLSTPLLTTEAREELDAMSYAPLDPEGRDYKNLYQIIVENDIQDLLDSDKFGNFFSSFGRLIENEKKYKGD